MYERARHVSHTNCMSCLITWRKQPFDGRSETLLNYQSQSAQEQRLRRDSARLKWLFRIGCSLLIASIVTVHEPVTARHGGFLDGENGDPFDLRA